MVATDGPMAALGVVDPRSWAASDWLTLLSALDQPNRPGLARSAGAVYTRYADDLAFSGPPH